MKENRQQARVYYSTSIKLRIGPDREQEGETVNISTGGVFIKTDPLLDFGQRLTLIITIPGAKGASEIPCIVRWVKPGQGIGLQFESLRPIEMWAINRLKRTLNLKEVD